jgi:hypothetical protein
MIAVPDTFVLANRPSGSGLFLLGFFKLRHFLSFPPKTGRWEIMKRFLLIKAVSGPGN